MESLAQHVLDARPTPLGSHILTSINLQRSEASFHLNLQLSLKSSSHVLLHFSDATPK